MSDDQFIVPWGHRLAHWSFHRAVTCVVSDRTSIVHPPEDRVVIKGTTATLCCGATHDPRTSLRLLTRFHSIGVVKSPRANEGKVGMRRESLGFFAADPQ